jgi:uncharacterized membrane protein (DUF2068 family)
VSELTSIRLIAFFEAFKGLLVLAAASGMLALIHKDLHVLAAKLVEHTHLNPASKYPRIFLDAIDKLPNTDLLWLAFGAAVYSVVRLAEGYGLYYQRAWAEVLAAASGAFYMPFEAFEWLKHPSWLRAEVFAVNAAVVAVMARALLHRWRPSQDNAA